MTNTTRKPFKGARFQSWRAIIALVMLGTLLLGVGGTALAVSDITDATYHGTIQVTNNSTAATNVATVMTLSSADLIAQGWANTIFDNIAIRTSAGADVKFMPSIEDNPWALWVPSIGADSISNYILYSGQNSLFSDKFYFPAAGGMTTTDDDSFELSDNFTIEQSGHFIATASGNLLDKSLDTTDEGFEVYGDGAGNIISNIITKHSTSDSHPSTNVYILPDGAGDFTAINPSPGPPNWDTVNDPVSNPDEDATFLFVPGVPQLKDAYTLQDPAFFTHPLDSIDSVKVYFRGYGEAALTFAQPFLRFGGGAEQAGTEIELPLAYETFSEEIARPGGGAWTWADFANLQAVIGLRGTGAQNARCTQVFVYISYTYTTTTSELLLPNAAGDYTAIATAVPAVTHYLNVDDPVTTPDEDTTHLSTTNAAAEKDAYHVSAPAFLGFYQDNFTVTVSWRGKEDAANMTLQPYLRLGGNETAGTETGLDGGYTDQSEALARPGGGTWTVADFTDLQVAVGLKANGAQDAYLTQVYLKVAYDYLIIDSTVTAPGIATGERVIRVTYDGADHKIFVDDMGTAKDTDAWVGSVPDTDNDMVCFTDGIMSYVEYHDIEVDGVEVQHIEWEYATTFTDSSAQSNDATPTFRTASSDADVSAVLISFQPISTALAPGYAVTDAPLFVTANITADSDFTAGAAPAGGPPGAAVIDEVAGDTPNIWIWGILGALTIAMIGLFLSYMERKFGSGGGTLILRLGAAVVVFGLLISFGKFDWWMLIFYLIIATMPLIASQHRQFSGNVGTLNLVGFLAFAWVGMTMINRVLEGQLITSAETAHLNRLMFTQEMNLLGMFNLPILNFDFFTQGIPSLLKWDYSFFGGNAQIFQYMLYSINAVVTMIILGFLIGTISQFFARTR